MKKYQEEYLELLNRVSRNFGPEPGKLGPEEFLEAVKAGNRISREARERGTYLLREELFPVLDNILDASDEEIKALEEFAGALTSGVTQRDIGLHYRIHLALCDRARHLGERDTLIRELYMLGMALHNLETMLSPNVLRLYTTRMRMYFTESSSYFENGYDDITDPETRGYIHRSMGNIALSYLSSDPESCAEKLDAISRSIAILSDPDVRAKTPSLPWDTYLFKSHQERTTLLNFLRSGKAGPDAFSKVLESAQIVQDRQLKATRERGEPLQPRWQYAYMAARYHCGAMLLPELLDGLYGLASSAGDNDMSANGMFSGVSAPAFYMEYSKQLGDRRYDREITQRINRMMRRMFRRIVRAPSDERNESLMFYLRQILYSYRELPDGIPFTEVLFNVFAARQPTAYARMWITGEAARELASLAADRSPEKLVGTPGFDTVQDVIWRHEELEELACRAGRLYDTGMIHFLNLESSACRGLFEEEEALIQLHAHCGAELLSHHPSTAIFADVAHGHHLSYDGKSGYPVNFSAEGSPMRHITSIVAAADLLASSVEEVSSRYRPSVAFDEACRELIEGSGTQYAPFVAEIIRDEAVRAKLREKLERWKREAYLDMYRRRETMLDCE